MPAVMRPENMGDTVRLSFSPTLPRISQIEMSHTSRTVKASDAERFMRELSVEEAIFICRGPTRTLSGETWDTLIRDESVISLIWCINK